MASLRRNQTPITTKDTSMCDHTQHQKSRLNAGHASADELLMFPPIPGILNSKVMAKFTEKSELIKQHCCPPICKLRAASTPESTL